MCFEVSLLHFLSMYWNFINLLFMEEINVFGLPCILVNVIQNIYPKLV